MKKVNTDKPTVGVSSCLLGNAVRFDGQHKRNRFVVDELSGCFELRGACPEVGIGLPIPRATIRLVTSSGEVRAVGSLDAGLDVTAEIQRFSRDFLDSSPVLDGYILKKDSPSCGMERVKLYSEDGRHCVREGVGLFAEVLMRRYPNMPVEEEGRLNDPGLRESFISRVFVYHRWNRLVADGVTASKLLGFHSRHKYLVMAHSYVAYRQLGRLLANLSGDDVDVIASDYIRELMSALRKPSTRKQHFNVMQHIMGYLKRDVDREDKRELSVVLESYRVGLTPLVVPLTLLRHHLRRNPNRYLMGQYYLNPYPDQLRLRNHI
ncbi:MAG: YbgA family protein [bacterium]